MNYKIFYLIFILSVTVNAFDQKREDEGLCTHVKGWLFWPSDLQLFCSKRASYERELLEAKMTLNACLVDNKNKEKDSEGMPVECKEAMERFEKIAGSEALNKVKEAYNKKFVLDNG